MTSSGNDDGAWVFVSHSHKDIKMVRQVRNELERHGHKPLMFYLKCLEDDSAQLPQLLRKEIEARTWFVLCDSPNSRASRWVQEEKEIVKALPDKVYTEVDISTDLETTKKKVFDLAKRATIFLSYALKDRHIAEQLADYLRQAGFRVLLDFETICAGSDWYTQIRNIIDDAVAKGFVLALLSPASLRSEWVAHETRYALEKAQQSDKSNIIPIVISDRSEVISAMTDSLKSLRYFDLTAGIFENVIFELIEELKRREME